MPVSQIPIKKGGATRRPLDHPDSGLTQRCGVFQDFRRDEDQQFAPVIHTLVVFEQEADKGQVAEHRYLGGRRAFVLRIDTADDHRAAVFDQNLRRYLFGVDGRARQRVGADTVLVYFQVHDYVVIRRDLRFYFQRQCCFAERNAGCTARRSQLVRNLRALFDRGFNLVCGDDTRARDDLAFAVSLQCRELQIQELGALVVEEQE